MADLLKSLARRRAPLADAGYQRARLDEIDLGAGVGNFEEQLNTAGYAPLRAASVEILQLNLGRVCNQACIHCHVDAGPDRRESMSDELVELSLAVLERSGARTLDITGGAPEMHPRFRDIVREGHRQGVHIIDRCNLTILLASRYEDLPEFLAEHKVEVVCSLPHYRQSSTDKQRGDGVFEASIEALQRLNAVGYGQAGTGLRLVLVTNPVGAFLPAGQASLESEWKRELKRLHAVSFDSLYTITNMPISRYLEWLEQSGNLERYMATLVQAFNPAAIEPLMCRNTLSVGYDGRLFDCDFNQMLELGLDSAAPQTLQEFDLASLQQRTISTGRHCFGCTAGAGSSCGGALDS
ncbi:MAG: radical SAM/Cys-rich protein [Planctomycetota bacterium]|jgi:radical SAM/Cys-rich protein